MPKDIHLQLNINKLKTGNKMKNILYILMILVTVSITAQEKCNFICHNGSVVRAFGDTATEAHILHHPQDILLGNCDTFTGEVGDECGTLSLPKLDFKVRIPNGLAYKVSDILGKIYVIGLTSGTFIADLEQLPKDIVLFLKVETYQVKKYIR